MTIYKLDINEIHSPHGQPIFSSHVSPRTNKKSEYYLSQEKAEKRQAEIRNSLTTLIGYVSNFEFVITPVEVIE